MVNLFDGAPPIPATIPEAKGINTGNGYEAQFVTYDPLGLNDMPSRGDLGQTQNDPLAARESTPGTAEEPVTPVAA